MYVHCVLCLKLAMFRGTCVHMQFIASLFPVGAERSLMRLITVNIELERHF